MAKNWLLNPGTSSQNEGYSSNWLIWLVCREPLMLMPNFIVYVQVHVLCTCVFIYCVCVCVCVCVSFQKNIKSSIKTMQAYSISEDLISLEWYMPCFQCLHTHTCTCICIHTHKGTDIKVLDKVTVSAYPSLICK